jgi:hypothetical protein
MIHMQMFSIKHTYLCAVKIAAELTLFAYYDSKHLTCISQI